MPDMGGVLHADMVVLHTTGSSFQSALNWLRAIDDTYVSAHKLISRTGFVQDIVPLSRIAYHAGKSEWHGRAGLNKYSIGIELENLGWSKKQRPGWVYAQHRNGGPYLWWQPFPDEQIAALLRELEKIGLKTIVGHDHIALPKGRKLDPGGAFPWSELQAAGYIVPLDVRVLRG